MDKRVEVSVVVVSYKCLMVLRLMLTSLRRSMEGIECEVFVVDNASNDGTAEYISEHYPWVTLIASDENLGFPRANNIALERCRGDVILLLNPDTVVPQHFLHNVVAHFRGRENPGAMGVNMTDGTGRYLPESKRGYTDLRTSFFKLTGLWHIAPKSPIINNYYLGQYDSEQVCPAPSLSGACMAFTRETMQRIGVFDPTYFMYSEDIDLSNRIQNTTSGNIYRGDLHIIHFKGESTPPRLRYIYHFYNSMLLFARKHEFQRHSPFVNALVYCGIRFGFVIASIRCIGNRLYQSNYNFRFPAPTLLVSDNAECINWFTRRASHEKNDITTASTDNLPSITASDRKLIVFDVDSDLDAVIATMRRLRGQVHFGFCSATAGVAFVYAGQNCRPLF